MRTGLGRLAAFAFGLALLGVIACDPQGGGGGGGGSPVASSPAIQFPAAYQRTASAADPGPKKADADQTSAAIMPDPTASKPDESLEQAKQESGETFDGAKPQDPAAADPSTVTVPADGGPRKGPRLQKPTSKEPVKKPEPPQPAAEPLTAAGQACKSVLAAHGQESDCKNPTSALIWGGIKAAFVEQFGTWKGAVADIVVTAVTMVLTGGAGAAVNVLKLLLGAASLWVLWGLVKEFYAGVKKVFSAPEGTPDHAEGVWTLSKVATKIAIMAGLVGVGKAAGTKLLK